MRGLLLLGLAVLLAGAVAPARAASQDADKPEQEPAGPPAPAAPTVDEQQDSDQGDEQDAEDEAEEPPAEPAQVVGPTLDQVDTIEVGDGDGEIEEAIEHATFKRDVLLKRGPLALILPEWRKLKQQLSTKLHLDLAISYKMAGQVTFSDADDVGSVAGDLDLFALWYPFGSRSNNSVVGVNIENRHTLTNRDPAEASFDLGSFTATASGVSGGPLTSFNQLWWSQRFWRGRAKLTFGKLDHDNYYIGNRVASGSSRRFLNESFSSKPAVAFPGNGAGVNLQVDLNEHFSVTAGVGDASGDSDRSIFDAFGGNDSFGALQVRYSNRFEKLGRGNYRILLWDLNSADETERPSGQGFSLSFDQEVGDRIIPFLRYSWAERGVRPAHQLIALGVGVDAPFGRRDAYMGIGYSILEPSNRELRDQTTFEIFYRTQLTTTLELTPSFQMIFNPSANVAVDRAAVALIRLRVAL